MPQKYIENRTLETRDFEQFDVGLGYHHYETDTAKYRVHYVADLKWTGYRDSLPAGWDKDWEPSFQALRVAARVVATAERFDPTLNQWVPGPSIDLADITLNNNGAGLVRFDSLLYIEPSDSRLKGRYLEQPARLPMNLSLQCHDGQIVCNGKGWPPGDLLGPGIRYEYGEVAYEPIDMTFSNGTGSFGRGGPNNSKHYRLEPDGWVRTK